MQQDICMIIRIISIFSRLFFLFSRFCFVWTLLTYFILLYISHCCSCALFSFRKNDEIHNLSDSAANVFLFAYYCRQSNILWAHLVLAISSIVFPLERRVFFSFKYSRDTLEFKCVDSDTIKRQSAEKFCQDVFCNTRSDINHISEFLLIKRVDFVISVSIEIVILSIYIYI